MTIVYLNDTQKPQYLFLHTLEGFLKELAPAESIEVQVGLDADQKLFIKTWGDRVLIGRTDA